MYDFSTGMLFLLLIGGLFFLEASFVYFERFEQQDLMIIRALMVLFMVLNGVKLYTNTNESRFILLFLVFCIGFILVNEILVACHYVPRLGERASKILALFVLAGCFFGVWWYGRANYGWAGSAWGSACYLQSIAVLSYYFYFKQYRKAKGNDS